MSVPDYAFSDVTTDLITGLPQTERGYDAIATFVCRLSKYAYFVACHSTITAEEHANLSLYHVVARHGMPKKLVSNRDPCFTSCVWSARVSALGC